MEARPKIEVRPTSADQVVDLSGWVALALLWGFTVWYLIQLPDTIPVHFNGAGQPDRYGDKGTLALLALVVTVLFAALSAVIKAVSKYAYALNYPVAITPANAPRQYRGAARLGRGLRLGLVLVFLTLLYQTTQVATGQAAGLGQWAMPAAVVLLLGMPGLWYCWTVARK